jgi:hypothetical protein
MNDVGCTMFDVRCTVFDKLEILNFSRSQIFFEDFILQNVVRQKIPNDLVH